MSSAVLWHGTLVLVAAFSVFCGVASVDDPAVSVGLLSAAVTGLGMTGLTLSGILASTLYVHCP
ncbi:hypothetical protein GTY54_05585 [Streptomyces sp. SID625]|nr:hypothetical protein [Streptomyces sp. SID625]